MKASQQLTSVLFLIIACLFVSFGSAQGFTILPLKELLENGGRLEYIKLQDEPQYPIEQFDHTKEYILNISNEDTTSTKLTIWLANNKNQLHAPFMSVGYQGPDSYATGETLSYIYQTIGLMCMGMNEETLNQVLDFAFNSFSRLSEEWSNDTKQYGDIYVTASRRLIDKNINLILDIENTGEPASEAWPVFCKFE